MRILLVTAAACLLLATAVGAQDAVDAKPAQTPPDAGEANVVQAAPGAEKVKPKPPTPELGQSKDIGVPGGDAETWRVPVKPKGEPGKAPEDENIFETIQRTIDESLSTVPIQWYGHFKLDTAYDSSRTNDGNTAIFVKPFQDGEPDGEFNMTARHTRLGLNYVAPPSWGPKAYGKLEIDFYGGGPAENRPNVRLRHAYMDFHWDSGIQLLAGQGWDVIQPLWQWKLNTAVGWNQGNTGFRRPQIRGTYEHEFESRGLWKIAFAVADPIARDIDGIGNDDAGDAGVPDLQGRLSFILPAIADKALLNFGISGLYGKREIDYTDGHDTYTTWLVGADVFLPLSEDVRLVGEVFTGQALFSYNGGIAQGFNGKLGKPVKTWGTFLNLLWKIDKHWMVVLGAGIDDPDDETLSPGNRSKNTSVFGNVRYSFAKGTWVGLEYDRMNTDYLEKDNAYNNRFQLSFCMKF